MLRLLPEIWIVVALFLPCQVAAEGMLEVRDIIQYGAIPNDDKDDGAAIKLACDDVNKAGGGAVYFPRGRYRVFSVGTVYHSLGSFKDCAGVRLVSDGAVLEIDPAQKFTTSYGTCFTVAGGANIDVSGFTVTGPALPVAQTPVVGVEFLRVADGTTNVKLSNCKLSCVIAGLICANTDGSEKNVVRNVAVSNLAVANSFLGINCQESGDQLTCDSLSTDSVHRSYFVHGVRGHRVRVFSKDPKSNDCQIVATARRGFVEDVDLSYTRGFDTLNSDDGSVGVFLGLAGEVTPTRIADVRIRLDVKNAPGANNGASIVVISRVTSLMQPDPIARGHRLENLTISGSIDGPTHVNPLIMMDLKVPWAKGDRFANISLRDLCITNSANRQIYFNAAPFVAGTALTLDNVVSTAQINFAGGKIDVRNSSFPTAGGAK